MRKKFFSEIRLRLLPSPFNRIYYYRQWSIVPLFFISSFSFYILFLNFSLDCLFYVILILFFSFNEHCSTFSQKLFNKIYLISDFLPHLRIFFFNSETPSDELRGFSSESSFFYSFFSIRENHLILDFMYVF